MFAELYHAHHSLHPEDLPFWIELTARHPGPLLELGCGTGRVLIPLAQAGRDDSRGNAGRIYGLEKDGEMLGVLKKRLPPELADYVSLVQADFTRFCLAQRFAAILMPCNTYSTLTDDERQATLERVTAHLQPGGIFAAGLPNPALLLNLPARSAPEVEEVFPHPVDGEPVQVSSGWQRTRQAFSLTWHYDHLMPDGEVERVTTQVRHRLLPPEAYLDELRLAGFAKIEMFGDFDRSEFGTEAANLIFVASLPAG